MRTAFDRNGDDLCEGMVVHLANRKPGNFVIRYIHRNGIVHIVSEDRKVGMKVTGGEIVMGRK